MLDPQGIRPESERRMYGRLRMDSAAPRARVYVRPHHIPSRPFPTRPCPSELRAIPVTFSLGVARKTPDFT
jgi:hypothetical protein